MTIFGRYGCGPSDNCQSANTYVLAQALRQHLEPGDEVIVTNQDHEANIGAWRRLEAEGVVVREWKVDKEDAELNLDDLDTWLGPRTRAVAFTVDGMPGGELATRLNQVDLGVGTGDFYARRLIEALDINPDEGALRASFVHYTAEAELNRLIESLDRFI